MPVTALRTGDITAVDYRCGAGPADTPYTEVHERFSLSYVRRGSFGCRTRGRHFELVAGAFLIGFPGDEFMCMHDHHAGDECLSFQFSPHLVEMIDADTTVWRGGAAPPLAELMILGELAQRTAEGGTDLGLDEVGMLLAARFGVVLGRVEHGQLDATVRERRRSACAAEWIDAHSHESIDLQRTARQSGLSAFHFLRMFTKVVGVTPHQHLIRCRLRRAARRLLESEDPVIDVALDTGFNDLSNFTRTFHRAAGVSPRRFRLLARGKRNFLQAEISPLALPFLKTWKRRATFAIG